MTSPVAETYAPPAAARLPKARIKLPEYSQMTPEQLEVYDAVVSGPRGQMIGPLLAALHSPELAAVWARFGEFLRFKTCLPKELNELAILVCGRRWSSQVEWWVHSKAAAAAGLPTSIIEAIERRERPDFKDVAQYEVYEFARLLQQNGSVSDEVYEPIKARWGSRGVVELTALLGYYTLVAMTLNAHRMPLPEGAAAPLEPSDKLLDLPEGKLLAA
jgi:4-carboxymuconolactone decarboxylase